MMGDLGYMIPSLLHLVYILHNPCDNASSSRDDAACPYYAEKEALSFGTFMYLHLVATPARSADSRRHAY